MSGLPLLLLNALAHTSVGIAPLASDDVQAKIQIEEMLLDAVHALDGKTPVSRMKMKRHIRDAAKLGVTCKPGQAECYARVGALSGVDLIVVAEYAKGVRTLRCRTVRSADGVILHDVSARLAADPADRKLGVVATIRASVSGAQLTGALDVVATAPSARVTVDGAHGDLSALAPGIRLLHVEADRFAPHDQEVEVFAGVTRKVVVKLVAERSDPPPPKTPTCGLRVGGAVATGAGFVAAVGLGVSAALVYAPEAERPNMTAAEWNLRSKVLAPTLGWSAAGGAAIGVLGLALIGLSALE